MAQSAIRKTAYRAQSAGSRDVRRAPVHYRTQTAQSAQTSVGMQDVRRAQGHAMMQGGSSMQMNSRMQSQYYTEGNTVRVAVPQPQPARRRRPQPQPRVREREADRTQSVSITLPLTLAMIAAVVMALFIGYNYLALKSELNISMNTVKEMETTLEALRTENDALEQSIDVSVDLNNVYRVAVMDLGMVRAGQDNIISYDKTESEYVRQYENIPAAN